MSNKALFGYQYYRDTLHQNKICGDTRPDDLSIHVNSKKVFMISVFSSTNDVKTCQKHWVMLVP